MKTKRDLLTAGFVVGGLALSLGQPENAAGEPAQNSVRGTPGVATQRSVVNFAELARQIARPAATPEASAAAPAGFASASLDLIPPSPAPASSFQAFDYLSSQPAPPSPRPAPPDTLGAVGPNHLMVTLNHGVRVQDRAGGIISTVSLSNFFGSLGPLNTYIVSNSFTHTTAVTADIFDPRVLYDPYDNRWIVCSTGDAGFPGDVGSNTTSLFFGVSQTSDPTGNWNLYRIDVDALNQTELDFPMIGFNKNWIVARGTLLTIPAENRVGAQIWVFNKTNLYAGGSGLYTLFKRSDTADSNWMFPATTYDPNLDTLYLLNQVGEGTGLNSLRIHTISGPIGSEVLTQGPLVSSTNRWDFTAPGGYNANFFPQLGSVQKFNSKGAFVTGLVYRNGSLWTAQTIFLPAGGAAKHSSIQWWQISPGGQIVQRGLLDDPTGKTFYGYPSLAVNKFNDVLVGYNRYSTNQFASANYAFRAGSDPLNTLRTDTVLKAGEAPYFVIELSDGINRWGDLSSSVVDPANDLDLWTIQEYPTALIPEKPNWGTWWGRISPIRVAAVEIVGSDGIFRFTTAPDQTYRVERADSLATPILWEPVPDATNVPGTGALVQVLDSGAATRAQRFYRVRLN